MSETPVKTLRRGAVIVRPNTKAKIIEETDTCVVLEFECRTKRCEIFGTPYGTRFAGINLAAVKSSLYVDKTKDKNDLTAVIFPAYKNWQYFTGSSYGKYTVRIVFVKSK